MINTNKPEEYQPSKQEISQDHLSEISHDSISCSLVYTTYENLVDIYQVEDQLEPIIDGLLLRLDSEADWKSHFEMLEHLRIFNKFHYLDLHPKLTGFAEFIIQNLDSLRSGLVKEGLIFLREVILNSKTKELPQEFLSKVVPVLIDKSHSDKGFIRTEAKKVVKDLETCCAGDATVVVFSMKSFDKNAAICEFSFQTLCEIIKNLGVDLQFKLTLGSCKALFRALIKALEGRRAVMKKQGEDLWRHLRTLLEKECIIETFLENKIGLNKQEITLLSQIKFQKKVAPRPNLQSFLKVQKTMMEKNPNIERIQEEEVKAKPMAMDCSLENSTNANTMEIISIGKENIVD